MKRSTPGGTSPAYKCLLPNKGWLRSNEDEDALTLSQASSHSDGELSSKLLNFKTSLSCSSQNVLNDQNFTANSISETGDYSFNFDLLRTNDNIGNCSQELSSKLLSSEVSPPCLISSLQHSLDTVGVSETASQLLKNSELKKELERQMLKEAQNEFKSSLSSSTLTKSGRDRSYLLSLTPKGLCEEFYEKSPLCFNILAQGFFGASADKACIDCFLNGKMFNFPLKYLDICLRVFAMFINAE